MQNKVIALLRGIKEGKVRAFDSFYNQTFRLFYTIAYGVLHSRSLAEEAVQDTYMSIYRNIDKIDLDGNVMSYLYVIVKNMALNILKKQYDSVDIQDEKVEMVIGDRNIQPMKEDGILEDCQRILDEQEYEILTLCLVKGFKRREVAQMLNSNTNTITWKYQRALKKLKKTLKEENYEY